MSFKNSVYMYLGLTVLLSAGGCENLAPQVTPVPKISEQVEKPRQDEAKQAVGSINRLQQSYHFERQTFANDLASLGYSQNVIAYGQPMLTGDAQKATVIVAATQSGLKSYSGGIVARNGEYLQILCETQGPSTTVSPPIDNGTQLSCPPGTTEIR